MRFLVIQHEDNCSADCFGQWWREADVALDVVYGPTTPVPATLDGYDALVVLGGAMGCTDDAEFPWLAPTRALIRAATEHRRPFLGICLGHQLAAVALGGEVARSEELVIGLTPVQPTDAGRADRLLGVVEPGALAVQYNEDVVTVPPAGAEVLATQPDGGVQALRFGDAAWGVQFHPECSPQTFDDWTVAKPVEKRPDVPGLERIAADVRAAEERLALAWRPLALRFRDIVAGRD